MKRLSQIGAPGETYWHVALTLGFLFFSSEIAPPPKDVNYSDLKEDAARIAWSLPDLSEMYRISGYALQYRMFGVQEWQGFATVRGTSRRMTGLEPGQAYVVRLKTNNPYGISEPSQHIEFKTPKGMGQESKAIYRCTKIPHGILLG